MTSQTAARHPGPLAEKDLGPWLPLGEGPHPSGDVESRPPMLFNSALFLGFFADKCHLKSFCVAFPNDCIQSVNQMSNIPIGFRCLSGSSRVSGHIDLNCDGGGLRFRSLPGLIGPVGEHVA